ncbi:hypothetical protein BH11PAT4_BH11PAT4_7710 [soil metagenome]
MKPRALFSLTNKTGMIPFAAQLIDRGFEIVSTGTTGDQLRGAGLEIIDIATVTGIPEGMDGRLKTISPFIAGGILADRDKPSHLEYLATHKIGGIDLVVVNLYAFNEALAAGATLVEAIEKIDIGGPSLLRAAAKNNRHCIPLPNPVDYEGYIRLFDETEGRLTPQYRLRKAAEAIRLTADYDNAIANYLIEKAA